MYDALEANKRRSIILILGFIALVVAVGWAFDLYTGAGGFGIIFALILSLGMSVFAYWNSDKVALAMSKAKPADPIEFAQLHNLVEGLSIASGLPKPRVYVINDRAPNAFATGRNPEHAAIAVTTGLLEIMNRVELEGVLAHEMAHIKNYDILVSTLAVVLVGVVVILSDIGLRTFGFGGGRRDSDKGSLALPLLIIGLILLLLAPLTAQIMQATIGRRRESYADITGVHLTRYPPGLISALEKLKADQTVVHTASRATAHLWIESPLARDKSEGNFSKINNLFDTHPPLDERIEALRSL